jgi:RNA polymerase sigma-70 factor (sigma-E family)
LAGFVKSTFGCHPDIGGIRIAEGVLRYVDRIALSFLQRCPNAAACLFVVKGEDSRAAECGVESWKQTLTELTVRRGAALKRHAFLLCGDDSRAEDLVQEALVRVFSRPLRVPRPGAAEAYVRVTMTNLFIDGARRHTRWTRAAPLLRTPAVAADPADQVAARDAMLTALSGLSPRQRACVVLRYYQDLPVAEVAAALGVGEGTVKRYLSEAMPKLAALLSAADCE